MLLNICNLQFIIKKFYYVKGHFNSTLYNSSAYWKLDGYIKNDTYVLENFYIDIETKKMKTYFDGLMGGNQLLSKLYFISNTKISTCKL